MSVENILIVIFMGLDLVLTLVCMLQVSRKADRKELEEKTQTIIDAKFAIHAAELHGVAKQHAAELHGVAKELRTLIEMHNERLGKGDRAFEKQEDAQREFEARALEKISAQREWIMQTFATRAEGTATLERLAKLELQLARMESR